MLIAKPLSLLSRSRRQEILADHRLSDGPIPIDRIQRIRSVNDPASWNLVRELRASAVVINGTRILRPAAIAGIGVPILNTHVGITPMYRGVHGAYWALVRKDRDHCGVTVHLVDEGVDTGAILHQALIHPASKDDFSTYPTLQMAVGCGLMMQALGEVIARTSKPSAPTGPSARWNHPTLWGYVRARLRDGIR
ncbi:MAG: formyl transferase [Flavobacteriales bacterium]|nr:formyl transferase [Flavobacteriales bacterium]